MKLRRSIGRWSKRSAYGLVLGIGFALGLLLAVFSADLGDPSADDLLRRQIDATLALHRGLMPFDIAVTVENGRARLSGSVDTALERELANRLARSISGVLEVDNGLLVEPDRARWLGRHTAMVGGLDDPGLAIAVRAQLHGNRATRMLEVDVSASAGTVVLRGHAPSARVSAAAARIAARTHGVIAVDNRLQVAGLAPAGPGRVVSAFDELSDWWLETRVRSALLYGSNVDGLDLGVRVDDQIVILSGLVTNRTELDLAQEIAAGIGGVRAVDSSAVRISL